MIWNEVKDYLFIALGLFLYTIAFTVFLMPYQIVAGGVTGLSAIIYYATGFHLENTYLIINGLLLLVALKILVVLIAPFAPHIAEELWEALGGDGSVCDAQWPKWDEQYLVETSVKLGVAFNGKTRLEMEFAADADNKTIEEAVLADERAKKYLEGFQVKKVIIVPKRMVNIVLAK